MPRIAILAYAFPPSRAVGALRPYYMAKYLAGAGWEVTVVTPDPSYLARPDLSGPTQVDSRRLGIALVHTDHRWRFLLDGWLKGPFCQMRVVTAVATKVVDAVGIDATVGWKPGLEEALRTLERQDVILATGPPYIGFQTAVECAGRMGAASILEYRDLWTDGPHAVRRGSEALRRRETHVLEEADAVWTISPSMSRVLAPRARNGIRTLPNGFDPDDFKGLSPREFGHRAVVYAGSFYPPKRVIDPVLAAVVAANRGVPRADQLVLHYFGSSGGVVRERAVHFGATEFVLDEGLVPRSEVLSALMGCSGAVVIVSVMPDGDASDATIVTAKLYEALGAGAPILLVAPSNSDARAVVDGSNAGEAVIGSDIEAMARWLRAAERPAADRVISAVERWSWPKIGGAAADALTDLVRKRQESRAPRA